MPRVGARYIDEWNALTERIGFWIDTDDAYYTLDNEYIESVWWSLKQVFDRGLLTEGHKVVPYCPRCGTALSSHEVAQGYQDVVDPSVYVRSRCSTTRRCRCWRGPRCRGRCVPHAAIAVNPEVTYVRARLGDERLILAEPLVERVLGEGAEIEERMPGSELLGPRYEPPFPYITDYGERAHTVLAGGLRDRSRTAPGSCTPAPRSARTTSGWPRDNGLTIQNPVRPDGTFDERIGPVRRACTSARPTRR